MMLARHEHHYAKCDGGDAAQHDRPPGVDPDVRIERVHDA
jgi:hypothetical protein